MYTHRHVHYARAIGPKIKLYSLRGLSSSIEAEETWEGDGPSEDAFDKERCSMRCSEGMVALADIRICVPVVNPTRKFYVCIYTLPCYISRIQQGRAYNGRSLVTGRVSRSATFTGFAGGAGWGPSIGGGASSSDIMGRVGSNSSPLMLFVYNYTEQVA